MAEERRQNIFVTLATNGVTLRKKEADLRIAYPFSPENVPVQDDAIPFDVMIALGDNALSLEDCEECIEQLNTCMKSHGCKMTPDRDLNYCAFKVENGDEQLWAECVMSFIVKG